MSDTTLAALISGVVGLFSGAVGSLIAPWVNWGIEKRRKQFESRSELIRQWREIIANTEFDRSTMLKNPLYGALRPLLSPEALKNIERPSTHLYSVIGGPPIDNHDRVTLLHEVARIEREWELV
jgi:hypothetical protein